MILKTKIWFSLYPNPAHNELHVAIPKKWIGQRTDWMIFLGRTQSGILSDDSRNQLFLEVYSNKCGVLKVGSKQSHFLSVHWIQTKTQNLFKQYWKIIEFYFWSWLQFYFSAQFCLPIDFTRPSSITALVSAPLSTIPSILVVCLKGYWEPWILNFSNNYPEVKKKQKKVLLCIFNGMNTNRSIWTLRKELNKIEPATGAYV